MSHPIFPNFKSLELSDKPLIEKMASTLTRSSDYNFSSLWSWDTDHTIKICMLDASLVVEFRDYVTGLPFYSILGSGNLTNQAELLLKAAPQQGKDPNLKLIPQEIIQHFDASKFRIIEDPDNHDYILDSLSLVILRANEFRGKRSLVNHFLRKYGHDITVQLLDLSQPNIQSQILILFDEWMLARYGGPTEDTSAERTALQRLMQAQDTLDGVLAVGIYDKSKLIGFSIIEIQKNGEGILHFEKALTAYKGIYTYLNRQVCGTFLKYNIRTFNYEQDLGIPGLRQAKELYHPTEKIKKYQIALR